MLKFIRKYQLIILVVGGSLLMVVFLLQPVLTRLSPSPLKTKVATLGDGTTFTRADIQRADAALTLLGRSNPRALQPRSVGGLGLEGMNTDDKTKAALHWLLLADHARKYGLVGEAGDGASWIQEIAEIEAFIQVRTEAQQGMLTTPQEQEQRLLDLKTQIISIINRNANAAANSMRGTMDDVYRALAEARGMYRLMSGLDTLPAYSDVSAVAAAEELFDAVAINAVLIDSNTIASAIDDPSDEELQAFFDEYKALNAQDSEFGIGYVQPTRIKLGWLTLNKNTFMNSIEVDRVELNKMWRLDRETYPGDFAAERFALKQRFRNEKATDMMVEADRMIRAQVLAKTNTLPKRDGIVELPEDWASNYPKLDEIAQAVTERINEQFSVSLPTPEVVLMGDRWLNQNDIAMQQGIGMAVYRIGSRQIPVYALPQFFQPDAPENIGLDVQPLLPIVDHAATDQAENRYYAMVLDVRDAGPSDTIADIGRDRVLSDYKSLKAYELLQVRADGLLELVRNNDDLAPAIDEIMSMVNNETDVARPSVLRQILVRKDTIDRGRIASFVDPRLNTESFRDAVINSSQDIDPLVEPETLQQNPVVVSQALPKSRSIALALVLAPRPLTAEEFMARANQAIQQASRQELLDAGYFESNPFSFESLSERYGLVLLKGAEDDDF